MRTLAWATAAATITYTYDNLYRVTNAKYSTGLVLTYTYDAVGNRLTQTVLTDTTVFTYDVANRLTNVGPITNTWDNNGNLLSGGGFYTYTYDTANRLVKFNQGAVLTYTLAYNGQGDRVSVAVNGVPMTYTLDLNAGLTQILADGTNTYLYGNGRIAQRSSTTTSYFLGDALGSVRQLASTSGAVVLTRWYDPYGNILSNSNSGSATTVYGFTGEWGGGLIDLRARWYSPAYGRFIQKDTWGDYSRPLSLNGWAYVEDNPVNRVDPSGHWYCQSGAVPFGDNCSSWVQNALTQLANSGTTGKKLSDYYHERDRALTILGIGGGLVCAPVAAFATGIKVYFEPVITRRIGALAFTLWPDQIHINNSRPGYSGSTPSPEAVVTFGHEIGHLAQGPKEFSVQGEVLSTIVGYYLENDLGVAHRSDANFIIDNRLDPWSETDLQAFNNSLPQQLLWPLLFGGGFPRNWLTKWDITLPYPIAPEPQQPPLPQPQPAPTPPGLRTTPSPPGVR